MKEEIFGYSLLLIVRKKRDEGLFSGIIWCLFFTELNKRLLMIVCIPYSGIHSRVGQRLTGERMIRPAGEWESVFHVLFEKFFNEGV